MLSSRSSAVETNASGGLNSPGNTMTLRFLCVALVGASLLLNVSLLVSLGPSHLPPVARPPSPQPDHLITTDTEEGFHSPDPNRKIFTDTERGPHRRLAVVVPTHDGDLDETIKSLEHWPTTCPEDGSLSNVELVIYKAEARDDPTEKEVLPRLRETAGRCFAYTRMVYASLTKEENVYPDGPSIQFYKMFVDENVKAQFAQYDVFAIIEHDVLVVDDSSFTQLYKSAFFGSETYWVKGSVLAGTNFHETAVKPELWHVLGHINGNALYNNTDPAFAEFVGYTMTRWSYTVESMGTTSAIYRYPYDVALWATIADFPYSWPLWQRYSDKFVNTHLIANIGFVDVDHATISDATARGTFFIHGSSTARGSQTFAGGVGITLDTAYRVVEGVSDDSLEKDHVGCKPACGTLPPLEEREPGISRACDPSCHPGEQGVRFGGFLCGAGNPSAFGKSCRTCYTDQKRAIEADAALRSEEKNEGGGEDGHGRHVIMCDTLRPPPALDCTVKCSRKPDTVCDQTCGTGRLGDYHCSWRNHGTHCRYCFNDVQLALQADQIAQESGGRVIMCDTHEPPMLAVTAAVDTRAPRDGTADASSASNTASNLHRRLEVWDQEPQEGNPSKIPFTHDVARGEMCAFVPGYFMFIAETKVTVQSVLHFMPGMRVVVAVHPSDAHVYGRTMPTLSGVRIAQTSRVAMSGLLADRYCGAGTKLIYYLNPGELLSRAITFKDTHSPRGDLLVVYNDHIQASASILGFTSPTFGPDLLLPAAVNGQVRDIMLAAHGSKEEQGGESGDAYMLQLISRFPNVSVPQVLATVAYARNPEGMWFLNPSQWVKHHLFKDASIWDIPLVKPRFGCLPDMSLTKRGYDMGRALRKYLGYLKAGVSCETGFLKLDVGSLEPNPTVEFSEATGEEIPDIKDSRVSVMYSLFDEDEVLLCSSLSSVVKYFPAALEVVLVVATEYESLFGDLAETCAGSFPFPVRLVTDASGAKDEESGRGLSRQRTRRVLTADEYCEGDFVLQLDPTTVLFQDVTYDVVFHFGKPVMPYKRHPDGEWEHIVECRESETALVFDKPVRHQFTIFNTNVYPRGMYADIREFIGRMHGSSFEKIMSRTDVSWAIPGDVASCSLDERELVLPDNEFIGAYLWFEMHDHVSWLAVDPRDKQQGDWAVDVYSFAWACHARLKPSTAVESEEEIGKYIAELTGVDSPFSCWQFNSRWVYKS